MASENYLVNTSGTILNFTGSHTVSLVLLCGVSGARIIPLQVNTAGYLMTASGA